MAPEVDITNPSYGDIVATTSVFISMFFVPSRDHWKISMAYLVFGGFLYVQMRYKILRWQSASCYGTKDEHVTTSYLWALPLGILAASWGSDYGTGWWSGIFFGILAFLGHNVLHFLFVRYVITWAPHEWEALERQTFWEALEKSGSLADYCNTNPVEVLRSRYLTKATIEPMVFYRAGKDHLQPRGVLRRESLPPMTITDILQHDIVASMRKTVRTVEIELSSYGLCDLPDAES